MPEPTPDDRLTATSRYLRELGIPAPTLVLDEARARANVAAMIARSRDAGVRLRPHFKSHQSAEIGGWFADEGMEGIAVASLPMARYFADAGWRDITLARLVHPGEAGALAELERELGSAPDGGPGLGVLADDPVAVAAVASALASSAASASGGAKLRWWIKVDTGYGRTGVRWDDGDRLADVARAIVAAGAGPLAGVLTHAGHSYHETGASDRLAAIHAETAERLDAARTAAASGADVPPTDLLRSSGDTPSCSVAPSLAGVDELRPGNFVFFDLMQREIGACTAEQIAVAVACPIIGFYPERREVVVHGGAVHFAKEYLTGDDGEAYHGELVTAGADGLGKLVPGARLVSLSQEHGVVRAAEGRFDELFGGLAVGDPLLFLPVHSCLTCDLYDAYLTLDGRRIARRRGGAV